MQRILELSALDLAIAIRRRELSCEQESMPRTCGASSKTTPSSALS